MNKMIVAHGAGLMALAASVSAETQVDVKHDEDIHPRPSKKSMRKKRMEPIKDLPTKRLEKSLSLRRMLAKKNRV